MRTAPSDEAGQVVVHALDMRDERAQQFLAFQLSLGEPIQRLSLETHQPILQS